MTITTDSIKRAVTEAIAEARHGEYPEEHKAFIEVMMIREQRKAELWESIKSQILGWGIIGIVGAIGAYVGGKLGISL
jgi:hypothetical protein